MSTASELASKKQPEGVVSVEAVPSGIMTEVFLAMRYAIGKGWIAVAGAAETEKLTDYQVDDKEEICCLDLVGAANGQDSFCLTVSHNFEKRLWQTTVAVMTDLAPTEGKRLTLEARVYLGPKYQGPKAEDQFLLVEEFVNLRLPPSEGLGLEFSWTKDGLVVKSVSRSGREEVQFSAGKWTNQIAEKRFAQLMDPGVVEVPQIIWLSLIKKVLDNEVQGMTPARAMKKVEEYLLRETTLAGAVFGCVPSRWRVAED